MRVLFDQGTPVPLRGFLNSHTVTTVYEMGWSRTRNGDLLQLADQQMFDVFLTTGIADDKLASDPKTHGQDSRSLRLNSAGRFHRN